MKTILSVIFLSAFCYHADAQTATSSAKNAQVQTVAEPVQSVQPAKATVVSTGKHAEVKEVPLENNQTALPETKESTSSARKPD